MLQCLQPKKDIDFKIVHIPGKDNTTADHLSRLSLGAQHLIIPEGVMELDWSI